MTGMPDCIKGLRDRVAVSRVRCMGEITIRSILE